MSNVDTRIPDLIINKLTKAQYNAALNEGTISDDELYMITDETYPSFNDLANVATTGEYNDLLNKPTVDQSYNGSSTNAQSGTAVANAISSTFVVMNAAEYANTTPVSNVFYFIKES